MVLENSLLNAALRDTSDGPRHYRRFLVNLSGLAWCVPLHTYISPESLRRDLATHVSIRDISLTGLYFVSETFFSRGTGLWVQTRVGEELIQMPAQVRRAVEVLQDGHRLTGCGLQFLRSRQTAEALPVLADYLLGRPEAAYSRYDRPHLAHDPSLPLP